MASNKRKFLINNTLFMGTGSSILFLWVFGDLGIFFSCVIVAVSMIAGYLYAATMWAFFKGMFPGIDDNPAQESKTANKSSKTENGSRV